MDHQPPRPEQPYAWDDERLSAYLDGELSAPEQAQLEARLVVDPELRQLVDELRAVRQQLEILPEYRLKPTFADQVLRRAEQEMLLSPLGRDAADSVATPAASPVTLPATVFTTTVSPLAKTQPAVSPLSSRAISRRWRRGAIWTAVAAAAVLLLMVTNRPNISTQVHVAQHDPRPTEAAKPTTEKEPVGDQAALSDPNLRKQLANSNESSGSLNGIAVKESESEQLAPQKNRDLPDAPLAPAEIYSTTVAGNTPSKITPAAPQSAPPLAAAALPPVIGSKPGAAGSSKPGVNQSARSGGANNPIVAPQRDGDHKLTDSANKNAAARANKLLKGQAPEQRREILEKQSATFREQVSPEVAALLASEDYSRLTTSRPGNAPHTAGDQLLVVYVTPRVEHSGERSFESLLANNSIELSEQPFSAGEKFKGQGAYNAPIAIPQDHDVEPLAKSNLNNKDLALARDRKATETGEPGIDRHSANGPQLTRKSAPATAPEPAKKDQTTGNELYYLEADESQVDNLLRQLRSSPEQFSRLNIMTEGLQLAADSTPLKDEKNVVLATPATPPQTFADRAADKRAEAKSLANGKQFGQQQTDEQKLMAEGAAPALSAGVVLPTTPAGPASGAMPFAAPSPEAPLKAAPVAQPLALPSGEPAAGDGEHSTNLGMANRRASQAEKTSSKELSDRTIAYRLRGVESILHAKPGEQASLGEGGGGVGMAAPGKAELGEKNSKGAAIPGYSAKASDSPKPSAATMPPGTDDSTATTKPQTAAAPSDASGEMKADAAPSLDALGQAAKQGLSSSASQPKKESAKYATPENATPGKKQQPKPRSFVESSPASEQIPTPNESQQRQLERSKETAIPGDTSLAARAATAVATALADARLDNSTPAESANKASPATTKRVRVLFVIEHEPRKD